MQKIYVGIHKMFYYNVYDNHKRKIYAPSKMLKDIQKQILSLIKLDYTVNFNIKETATIHCNQKWILKLDIRKFYESISQELIENAVTEFYDKFTVYKYLFSEEEIYQLCTVEDKLPTGAVTSSYIAYIAFCNTQIDKKLMEFCNENNLKYSRYMDDMFFSGEKKIDLKKAEKLATKLLKEAGFEINHEKTQYISDNKRQEILGLVVNNSDNCVISCNKKHEYRAMFFNYLKAVYFEERLGISSLFKKKVGYKEVTGHLAYIKSSDPKFYETIRKFISSKIYKFGIYNNDEIKKLRKVIK